MRSGTSAGVTTDLVERARRGDRTAFDELYERNAGRVYALCFRLTGDPLQAEQLTQDAFVRAWRRIGSFRGESRFSTWLHRLAVNVTIDAQRCRGREGRRTADIETTALPGSLAGEPEARLDLERAIARLPDRARTALVLHTIEGYRYREVAELMDVALGTVKALIFQARARLLEELNPEPRV
jgi:RNA polymerase sigma-70 factor (ECF subfamily)